MGNHPVSLPHCPLPWRSQAPGDCGVDKHHPATTPGSKVLSSRPHPSQASMLWGPSAVLDPWKEDTSRTSQNSYLCGQQ